MSSDRRLDPFVQLPAEITRMIISHFDPPDTEILRRVSHNWKSICEHVVSIDWLQHYFPEFGKTAQEQHWNHGRANLVFRRMLHTQQQLKLGKSTGQFTIPGIEKWHLGYGRLIWVNNDMTVEAVDLEDTESWPTETDGYIRFRQLCDLTKVLRADSVAVWQVLATEDGGFIVLCRSSALGRKWKNTITGDNIIRITPSMSVQWVSPIHRLRRLNCIGNNFPANNGGGVNYPSFELLALGKQRLYSLCNPLDQPGTRPPLQTLYLLSLETGTVEESLPLNLAVTSDTASVEALSVSPDESLALISTSYRNFYLQKLSTHSERHTEPLVHLNTDQLFLIKQMLSPECRPGFNSGGLPALVGVVTKAQLEYLLSLPMLNNITRINSDTTFSASDPGRGFPLWMFRTRNEVEYPTGDPDTLSSARKVKIVPVFRCHIEITKVSLERLDHKLPKLASFSDPTPRTTPESNQSSLRRSDQSIVVPVERHENIHEVFRVGDFIVIHSVNEDLQSWPPVRYTRRSITPLLRVIKFTPNW